MEEINFCEWSSEKLMLLIDFLGLTEVTTQTEMESKYVGEKCVEKSWTYYDKLTIHPEQILFSVDPYPSQVVFTAEKFIKMKKLFETL